MSARSSRSFGAALGDFFTFAGYVKATSSHPLDACMLALRESPRKFVWFGGFNTRVIFHKSKTPQKEVRFEIEYYRQSKRSSRSSHMVQRLRGVMYQDGGRTHVVGKVNFTSAALLWLWVSIALTLLSIGVLVHTRNMVMLGLIGMTGIMLLVMILVLWLDRYHLARLIRRSINDSSLPAANKSM